MNWIETDYGYELPIGWLRAEQTIKVAPDREITKVTFKVVTKDLPDGGYFDEFGLYRNLFMEMATGNNLIYFPIAPISAGSSVEIPVYGALDNTRIHGVYLVPKSTITGHNTNYAQLQFVNKENNGVMATLTLLEDIDAPAYKVTPFGPINEHSAMEIHEGASFKVIHEGGGLAIPESVLIVEWNLR